VLDRLMATSFASVVGETFVADTGEAGKVDLELRESRLHDPDAPALDESGARAPFTLVFRGPPEPLLPQRIYRLEHDFIGALEIFLVPIGQDADGVAYEAVFG
jgi:hypothetical protein